METKSRPLTTTAGDRRAPGRRLSRAVAPPGGLTRREVDVLALVAQGYSNPQIATELVISRKTVSAHLEHIYTKLGVRSRTRAALVAMQQGLVALQGASTAGG